ncbi:MAG TPA: hypothetical protein VJB02_03845 [Coxiellaceae bacterium]|nr:hypothetical protein [Coxiellaceae bacterium]
MMFLHGYSNHLGVIGVILVLWAYFLIQINRINKNGFWFSFTNLLGSVLILISLYYHPNLASVVIEICWLLISAFGLTRWGCKHYKNPGL